MDRSRYKIALAIAASVLCFPLICHADIYGYIDESGGAHFSTEKLDERYQLFLKGGQPFDSSQLPSPAATVKSPVLRYLSQHPNLKKYEPLLSQAAREFNLDPALLKAVMAAESGFNPAAVSPKGAVGLMQILPATAERYGLQPDVKQTIGKKLADPKTNIRLGARYLRDLQKLFPNQPELVLASYNAGEGAVQRYGNRVPPYAETRNYVQVVTQFHQFYKPASAQTVALSGNTPAPGRIHMTIPGRGNLPATAMSTFE